MATRKRRLRRPEERLRRERAGCSVRAAISRSLSRRSCSYSRNFSGAAKSVLNLIGQLFMLVGIGIPTTIIRA
ncbi:MAG: hypothetical protein ACLRSW_08195 [Christensenellaceae bacterium]